MENKPRFKQPETVIDTDSCPSTELSTVSKRSKEVSKAAIRKVVGACEPRTLTQKQIAQQVGLRRRTISLYLQEPDMAEAAALLMKPGDKKKASKQAIRECVNNHESHTLTQSRIAEQTGLSRTVVSRYLREPDMLEVSSRILTRSKQISKNAIRTTVASHPSRTLTQSQIAKKTGLSRPVVSLYLQEADMTEVRQQILIRNKKSVDTTTEGGKLPPSIVLKNQRRL